MVAVIAFAAACSTDARGGPAEDVLAEAFALAEQAKQTTSLRERWTLYATAHAYLQQIAKALSDSDIAGRLRDEETVDGAQYVEVKRALLKTGAALCERNFTAACVLQFAHDVHRVLDPFHPGEILGEIAKAQAVVGDIAGAIATLETASSYSIGAAIPSIMAAMVKSSDIAGAIETANGYPDDRERDGARLAIVRALAEGGKYDDGRRVAASIEDHGDRARALAALAGASRTAGLLSGSTEQFAQAISLAEGIGDAEARATLLLEIAGIQLVAGDVVHARETFTAALAAARAITNTNDRSHVLDIAVSHLENAGLSSAARDVVEEFRQSAARMDEMSNAALDLIDDAERRWKAGDATGAKAMLLRARRIALELEPEGSREYAFRILIGVRAEMDDVEGALADWALIPGLPHVRSEVLEAQARTGDMEGLRRMLETIERDSQREISITHIVIPALARSGRVVEAHDFADRIVIYGSFRDRAMVSLAAGEAAIGDFEAAHATARGVRDVRYRADAFREIAKAHLAQGRVAQAKDILLTAFRGMFGPEGIRLPDHALDRAPAEALKDIGKLLGEIETRG